MISKYVGR